MESQVLIFLFSLWELWGIWCSQIKTSVKNESLVHFGCPLALCWAPSSVLISVLCAKTIAGAKAVLWFPAWTSKCVSLGHLLMYLSNHIFPCISRNQISEFLGNVFFFSKHITTGKAESCTGVYLLHTPLSVILGKPFSYVSLQNGKIIW